MWRRLEPEIWSQCKFLPCPHWTLDLAHQTQQGAGRLHNSYRGSSLWMNKPFIIVFCKVHSCHIWYEIFFFLWIGLFVLKCVVSTNIHPTLLYKLKGPRGIYESASHTDISLHSSLPWYCNFIISQQRHKWECIQLIQENFNSS